MQLEANYGRRGIRGDAEFALDRVDREEIAVRMVAFRGTRAAVSRRAEIRSGLQGSRGELAAFRIARVERQFLHGSWNIHDNPVPESAAGRRVGIIAGHGETL